MPVFIQFKYIKCWFLLVRTATLATFLFRFVMLVPKTQYFWSKWAKVGLILFEKNENPDLLNCIPEANLQNTPKINTL